MQLDKAIQSRHSVKKFKSKKPDWRDILECIDVARYAPMAGNIFSLKFILVENPQAIQKIADATQQNFIAEAKYVLVICSKTFKTTTSFKKKGETYLRQQAGAAIQNFLLKLQEKGLSTCWIGHFVEEQIKRELNIPEGVNVEGVFPIGYEHPNSPKQKNKIDINRILFFHKYGNKRMKPLKKLNV